MFFFFVVHIFFFTSGVLPLLYYIDYTVTVYLILSWLFPSQTAEMICHFIKEMCSFFSFFFLLINYLIGDWVRLNSKAEELGNTGATAHLPHAMFHLAGIQRYLIELIQFSAITIRCCRAQPNRSHYSAAEFLP